MTFNAHTEAEDLKTLSRFAMDAEDPGQQKEAASRLRDEFHSLNQLERNAVGSELMGQQALGIFVGTGLDGAPSPFVERDGDGNVTGLKFIRGWFDSKAPFKEMIEGRSTKVEVTDSEVNFASSHWDNPQGILSLLGIGDDWKKVELDPVLDKGQAKRSPA